MQVGGLFEFAWNHAGRESIRREEFDEMIEVDICDPFLSSKIVLDGYAERFDEIDHCLLLDKIARPSFVITPLFLLVLRCCRWEVCGGCNQSDTQHDAVNEACQEKHTGNVEPNCSCKDTRG